MHLSICRTSIRLIQLLWQPFCISSCRLATKGQHQGDDTRVSWLRLNRKLQKQTIRFHFTWIFFISEWSKQSKLLHRKRFCLYTELIYPWNFPAPPAGAVKWSEATSCKTNSALVKPKKLRLRQWQQRKDPNCKYIYCKFSNGPIPFYFRPYRVFSRGMQLFTMCALVNGSVNSVSLDF